MRVENLRDTVLDIFPWLPTFLRAPQVRNSEERYHSQSFQKFILAFSSRVTPFCFPYTAFFLRHKLPNIDSIVSMFYVQELCFLICKVGIMIAGSQDKIASSTCKSRLHPRLSLLLCRKETLSLPPPLQPQVSRKGHGWERVPGPPLHSPVSAHSIPSHGTPLCKSRPLGSSALAGNAWQVKTWEVQGRIPPTACLPSL